MFRCCLLSLFAVLLVQYPVWGDGTAGAWDEETLDLFRALPVQDGGRIKPMDTFAQFRLLKLSGKRTYTPRDGERGSSMAWLLDCMFYPDIAEGYDCFIVDNSEVIASIGVPTHPNRRSRYSYTEVASGRTKLFELARAYMQLDAIQRTPLQNQIIHLADSVFDFEQLTHFFDFSRERYHIHEGETLVARTFSGHDGVPLSKVIELAQEIVPQLEDPAIVLTAEERKQEHADLANILTQASKGTAISKGIDLIPPLSPEHEEWLSPLDVFMVGADFPQFRRERLELLALLERLPELRDDRSAFRETLREFNSGIVAAATQRGEYAKISLETQLYKRRYLFYSQWLFVVSFLLTAVLWLRPANRLLYGLTVSAFTLPIVLLVIGITLRCIIRGRPPVTTLYETVLFITAVATLSALTMELLNRRRIALGLGGVMGVLGMFLAFRYEAKEGVDTMPTLIAVLDTNFWLATHVTTVVAGYAAGLLAAGLSHIYILGRLLGLKKNDTRLYELVTQMSYGIVCFGLLFAAVGTILGGVWANDSWGRFWGWDPKENGALMIVLWMLIMLHARTARYVKELGLHVCAIILGMIVAFSWWGVNNLGVGLHAYGFTDGLWRNLAIFWCIETVMIVLGGV